VVLVTVPEAQFLSGVRGNRRVALLAAAGFLLLALALGWLLASRVARPLRRIADDLERVARFDLDGDVGRTSRVREIAVVLDEAERMKASLRSFGRYVPTEVVRDLVARGGEARLGGVRRNLTVLFADAVGFTRLAEGMDPSRLAEHLGEFLGAVTDAVRSAGGTVDKFMGDGVLAFFNAPGEVADHPAAACRAALDAQRRLADLARRWSALRLPVLAARVGIHVGDAVVGNLGTPERFGYTVLGDTVNLASRLEGLNRRYGTSLLASADVRAATGTAFEWRAVDRVAVVGRTGTTDVQELLGHAGRVPAATLEARDAHEAALEALQARDFGTAAAGFERAATLRPDDRAAPALLTRARSYLATPPPADWRGALELGEK
jgi:adenylate cyclase